MKKVRSLDTTPEIKLRKALWSSGLRYRLHASNLPGNPDIVLPSKKLAIFVDGDFWHGNQWKTRRLNSLAEQFRNSENKNYWISKIRGNESRDIKATARLLSDGWKVLRFWESQINKNLEGCKKTVMDAVSDNNRSLRYFTVAEFFAGIGLMRIGLEKQGWNTVFANDIDPNKYEMYKANFGDEGEQFVLGDIHDLPGDTIPTVALATASFPCNDLSLAGARSGLCGKHSSAFWGFIRILQEMGDRKPPIVLIENVFGLLNSNKGEDFNNVLSALNDLGYAVDTFVLNAADFVPQSRVRLFIVGVLSDTSDWSVREQRGFYESAVRPKSLADYILTHPEIKWLIRPLPTPERIGVLLKDILEELPDSAPEWWNEERVKYILNQMSEKHTAIISEHLHVNDWHYVAVFRRVRNGKSMAEIRNDGIAGCLRTPRGGSGRQILLKIGNGRVLARLLTPRECARLMGADDYKITVSLNNALFGFGDAVCVPVVEWIAKNYLNPLMIEITRGNLLSSKEAYAKS